METTNLYFIKEMTQDELFLVEGGSVRGAGRAVGRLLKDAAEFAEDVAVEVVGSLIFAALFA